MKTKNNRMLATLWLALALVTVNGGCTDPSTSERITAQGATLQIPQRGDSAWAVLVAAGRFAARFAGDRQHAVHVTQYRREGESQIITFTPVEPGLGGVGTIRIDPDGTTMIIEIQQ